MKKYLLILLLLVPVSLIAQDLKCKDFKKGTFIGSTDMFPGVEWTIVRTKKTQIEWTSKVPQKYLDQGYPLDTLYAKVKWTKNCGYNFLYDGRKMKLKENLKLMNDSGGINVAKKKIEGNCYFYESHVKINGQEIVLEGKICKEE